MDLGLAPSSTFATDGSAAESRPFIGFLDDRGYFLARSPGPVDFQWSLVAIDALSGQAAFPPISLNIGPRAPKCFFNGTESLLCLDDSASAGSAWVIDATTGAVMYSGATELRASSGHLTVEQVGRFAIARASGRGVYGVGPRAEVTWFVPGEGSLESPGLHNRNTAPPSLAIQTAGNDRMVVFSALDGHIVSPKLDDGSVALSAAVYPGGFAVEVAPEGAGSRPDAVEFFDENGRNVGRISTSDPLAWGSSDVPIVRSAPESSVFSATAIELAKISRLTPDEDAFLIGSRLLASDRSSSTQWEQYDLGSGKQLKTCDADLGYGYVGTDGSAAVTQSGNPNIGLITKAVDLDTCDTVWRQESPIGSFHDVWRVDTTLVQLSDNGTELMSLVAPD